MYRVIITTGSFFHGGTPETQRVISRHRTREAAERALATFRRDCPLSALQAVIIATQEPA